MTRGTTAATKDTGHRAGLDHDEVVAHALALVEAGGAAALSMRKLAADLGVTTSTVYWHVGGRDELVAAVVALQSQRQSDLEVVGRTPAERVCSVARHVWDSALAHRNVTSLAHQSGLTPVLEQPLELAMARELEAAGLRGEEVRDALRAVLMCVAGFLVVAFRGRDVAPVEPGAGLAPETLAALAEPPDLERLFDSTVRAVIDSYL